MNFYKYFISQLEKGTEHCVNYRDKRLTRVLNAIFIGLLFIMFPLVIIHNIVVKDYNEFFVLVPIIVFILWMLWLNRKGKSQLTMVITSLVGIISVYPFVFINDSQIGIPYLALLLPFVSVVFIENRMWRNIIFVFGFITYIVTNMFQLMYSTFDTVEHLISIVFILFIFMLFKYIAHLQNNYEILLEEKNNTIENQSSEILKIQKQKHEQELKIKQNDMEMVVANNSVQVQIKENLVEQLRSVEKSDNSILEIKKIIMELKQQIESQKNISLLQENIEDVNTLFLEKILEIAPNISKTERELCMYLKLGLSTKEIATLKSTSTNTINVTKTRLRKKLGLKTNGEISLFLKDL